MDKIKIAMTKFCIFAGSTDDVKIDETAICATILFAFETGFKEGAADGSKKNYDLSLRALKETIQARLGVEI